MHVYPSSTAGVMGPYKVDVNQRHGSRPPCDFSYWGGSSAGSYPRPRRRNQTQFRCIPVDGAAARPQPFVLDFSTYFALERTIAGEEAAFWSSPIDGAQA